jgi:hypothetical protein
LKVAGSPEPAAPTPAAAPEAAPMPEPEAKTPPANDKPFDDEPFDAGVEADEESDPKKFIEQLTGKLGQSLRKYTDEQGQPDFELEKFAINSLLSATHTGEMDAEDQKDIISKVKKVGQGDEDVAPESGETPSKEPAPESEPSDEEGLDELYIYENMDNLFVDPKKNNMFQEGSNDILDEDRCTNIAKRKYDVWPSAYASGAVVKCRKGKIWKGLKEEDLKELGDYKSMTDEQLDEKWSEKYKRSIDCNNPKGFSQKAHCQGRKKHDESVEETAKKTDFSKEKESGLHGWFTRRGGEGSKGWVDCNTCRDGKCKPCGRKEGEHRSYPSCRPTPSACKTKGKGDSWGKKSANESNNNELHNLKETNQMNENQTYMFWSNMKGIHEDASQILHMSFNHVDTVLSDGNAWALDHIARAAESMEEVYHFMEDMIDENVNLKNETNNYMFWRDLKVINHASGRILEMDHQKIDELLVNGHGWAINNISKIREMIEHVYHLLETELDVYDGETQGGYSDEYGSVENISMSEAEYHGREVKLGKPTKGDVKKFKVYVKNSAGKVVKVNFGDPNMEIKRDNPERRKSFRARHKCSQAKDRTTPKYWSCRMWSRKPVSKIVEDLNNSENNSIFENKNKIKNMLRETFRDTETAPVVKPTTKPKEAPATPSRKDKPFLPTPKVQPNPKASK